VGVEAALIILRCRDPLGDTVVLHDHQWSFHVLEHPELAGQLAAVKLAIEAPDRIVTDRDRADRRCYYRAEVLPAPYDEDLLKVVVGLAAGSQGTTTGEVITAYATPRVKQGEAQQWP